MGEKNMNFTIKFLKIVNWILTRVSTLIWIIILLLAAYAIYDSYVVFNQVGNKDILKYKPQISNGKTEENVFATVENSVAWLTLDDTTVDYPIMQGTDNSEYLNLDPFGEFSLGGSIFLDYRNASDFTDTYNVVYGHHMEHGLMFGALDEYRNTNYAEEHQTGELIVGSTEYKLELFAVSECTIADKPVFEPSNNSEPILSFIRNNAFYMNDSYEGGSIIALTTCASSPSDARLSVFFELERR